MWWWQPSGRWPGAARTLGVVDPDEHPAPAHQAPEHEPSEHQVRAHQADAPVTIERDRDVVTLEALERELADLERELERVDRSGEGAGDPPAE